MTLARPNDDDDDNEEVEEKSIFFFQLVVSVMADQYANGREAERLGFGLHLPFLELTEEKLLTTIQQVIGEPTFQQTAQTLGSALMDQVS